LDCLNDERTINVDASFLFPYENDDDDGDDMESVLIGILSLVEINDVEARDDERIGQGFVDLSTFEGYIVDEIEDKHHPRRSIYVIIDS
jgi:hypothetical protein